MWRQAARATLTYYSVFCTIETLVDRPGLEYSNSKHQGSAQQQNQGAVRKKPRNTMLLETRFSELIVTKLISKISNQKAMRGGGDFDDLETLFTPQGL